MLELFRMRCDIDYSNSLDSNNKATIEDEMRKRVIEDEDFFAEHPKEIYVAWREYAKNIVKFNNKIRIGQFKFIKGIPQADETVHKLDEVLDRLFDDYYQGEISDSNSSEALNMFNKSIRVIEKFKKLKLMGQKKIITLI